MKKLLLMLLGVLMALPAVAASIRYREIGQLEYALNLDNYTAELTSMYNVNSKYVGDLVIPETVSCDFGEFTVTSIGSSAFIGSGLTSVIIPNTVTTIGNSAFSNCRDLTSVDIPNSVTEIGESAFGWCSGLTNVIIGNSVTKILKNTFISCINLTTVRIGKSVSSIDITAFDGCDNVKENVVLSDVLSDYLNRVRGAKIVIPAKVYRDSKVMSPFILYSENAIFSPDYRYLYEGDQLLFASVLLEDIRFPSSVKTVGEKALNYCDNIKTVFIEEDESPVTFLSAFPQTANVTHLNLNRNINYNLDDPLLSNLANLTVGENVSIIPEHCFDGCQGLTSVVSKATTAPQIFATTFEGSYNTSNLTIPEGCVPSYINPDNWWHLFTSLKTNEGMSLIPDFEINGLSFRKVGDIEDYQVEVIRSDSYTDLTDVVIPDSFILNEAMPGDRPDGDFGGDAMGVEIYTVVGIAPNAFSGFDNIVSVTTPSTLRYIGNMAFRNCTGLESAILNDEITKIDGCAFQGCSALSEIELPSALKEIGPCAFYGCAQFESLTFGDNIVTIGESAFSDCINLKSVEFGDGSNTSIGDYAFMKCANLTDVTIGDNYSYVGNYAFYVEKSSKTKTKSIYIGRGVTSIGAHAFENSFTGSIKFADDCVLKKIGEHAFDNSTMVTNELILPNSLEYIGDYAFRYCGTYSVKLPVNEKLQIGNYAFFACQWLEELNIEDRIHSVGDYAFANCDYISNDVILECLENIGDYAFSNCKLMPSIKISAADVGSWVLSGCEALKSVDISGKGRLGSNAFDGCSSLINATIDIPYISENVANGCSSLETVDLSGCVREIGNNAFMSCPIKAVKFGTDLERINSYAFRSTKLTCIDFPSASEPNPIIVVGSSAFSGAPIQEIHLGNRTKSIADYNLDNITLTVCDLGTSVQSISGNFPRADYMAIPGSLTSEIKWDTKTTVRFKKLVIEPSTNPLTLGSSIYADTLIVSRKISTTLGISPGGITVYDMVVYPDIPGLNLEIISPTNSSSLIYAMTNDLNLYIGSSVKTIDSAPRAKSVTISEGVQEIGPNAVYAFKCKSIRFPSSLKKIGLKLDESLESVVFADGPEDLEITSAQSVLCKEIYIGRNIVDNGIGFNSATLTKAVVGNDEAATVTKIPSGLFAKCTALEYAILSDKITEIGESAFDGCSNLKVIVFPANLTTLGDFAFRDCTGLDRIVARTMIPVEGNAGFNATVQRQVPLYVPDEAYDDYSYSTLFARFTNKYMHSGNVAESVVVEEVEELDNAKPGDDEIDLMMLAKPQRVLVGAEPRAAAPRRAAAANGSADSFYWFSPNPEIATITEEGILTVLKDEPTEIWCYALDGSDQKAVIGLNQFLLGDLNSDKKVDTVDLEMMIGHISAPAGSIIKVKAADFNGDGEINTVDLEMMISKLSSNN